MVRSFAFISVSTKVFCPSICVLLAPSFVPASVTFAIAWSTMSMMFDRLVSPAVPTRFEMSKLVTEYLAALLNPS
ncbi:hypothetical protein MPEAHAMD_7263 [Methylobacterium frigidaeris]|uniref:Uncharacterized protein n=1 Tax=Methylobacterium frigidaeris TaxID=2038277 RepID=A0AA37M914_9HYPH|nr:hypothetical protein MPEAHAMD_7263 [Methylobacterium frigidaeris]